MYGAMVKAVGLSTHLTTWIQEEWILAYMIAMLLWRGILAVIHIGWIRHVSQKVTTCVLSQYLRSTASSIIVELLWYVIGI
jgi:hypothetical protein